VASQTAGKENRKDQILKTAARMFCEKTFHGTTLQDIAQEVGMLKGSLYYYITSKEKLLTDIITTAVHSLYEGLWRVENANLGPAECVREIIFEHVKFNANYKEAGTLFLMERHILTTMEMPEVDQILKRRDKLLADTLKAGVDAGIFRPMDVRLTSLSVLGICNSLLFWYREGGRLGYAEIAGNFADIMEDGLRAR
jgi:TetR/AcrR family transcriptional regulator, cholesterol catabolism regulator